MRLILIGFITAMGCGTSPVTNPNRVSTTDTGIWCTDTGCTGNYSGPEFIHGSDVAHQFSNRMSREVGAHLKALYRKGMFAKADLEHIEMSTSGMGTGTVTYSLKIPLVKTKDSCDACTSFDHVGGWGHKPALEARKMQLKKALLPGESLYISDLKTTPEGLREYWIQWKNRSLQKSCAL